MANVHPWFAMVDVQIAAGWTWEFFEQTDVAAAQLQTNNPTMYIAGACYFSCAIGGSLMCRTLIETGWPTVSWLEVLNEIPD
jgi:hypothetical protein